MDIDSILGGLLSNAIWWILGLIVLGLVVFFRRIHTFWLAVPLAMRLNQEGIRRFHFSRNEYSERLDAYLDRSKHSIKIVSISLRLPNSECDLTEFFRRKLAANPSFEIHISLLQPYSDTAALAALSLNVSCDILNKEIDNMLADLKMVRNSLSLSDQGRLHLFTHNSLPMGSVLMLDTTPTVGIIQLETKLYRAPRVESFSFEIVGPSPFYSKKLCCVE